MPWAPCVIETPLRGEPFPLVFISVLLPAEGAPLGYPAPFAAVGAPPIVAGWPGAPMLPGFPVGPAEAAPGPCSFMALAAVFAGGLMAWMVAAIGISLPSLSVTLSNLRARVEAAPPFSCGCADVTCPVIFEPFGITVVLPDFTSSVTFAITGSPTFAFFASTLLVSSAEIVAPAGNVLVALSLAAAAAAGVVGAAEGFVCI